LTRKEDKRRYLMKVRIKFQKYGAMKFIGHLDVMRYFQKAFRRAGYESEYSKGYNPHQIMSFAAPLGLGITSDGEYLDAELVRAEDPVIMIKKLNDVMTEGFHITGFKVLKDREENQKAVSAMSLMDVADYLVSLKDGYDINSSIIDQESFKKVFDKFLEQDTIDIVKKTKKNETNVNIKPMIKVVAYDKKEFQEKLATVVKETPIKAVNYESVAEAFDNGILVYLQVSSSSAENLKPELVMEAFYDYLQLEFNKFAWQIHRLEIYTRDEETKRLIPLDENER